jgi:urease accessory protein
VKTLIAVNWSADCHHHGVANAIVYGKMRMDIAEGLTLGCESHYDGVRRDRFSDALSTKTRDIMLKRISITAAILAAAVAPAFAHISSEHLSAMTGLEHPLSGADHILAMVAVGLWASMIGGRARLIVPAAFVSTMALGFLLSISGVALPFVEPAILASVIGLGLLVAMAVKMPTAASAAVVAVFALFHGFAHGTEMHGAGALPFAAGFIASTIALHAAGIGLGSLLGRYQIVARLLGGATAIGGIALMMA